MNTRHENPIRNYHDVLDIFETISDDVLSYEKDNLATLYRKFKTLYLNPTKNEDYNNQVKEFKERIDKIKGDIDVLEDNMLEYVDSLAGKDELEYKPPVL